MIFFVLNKSVTRDHQFKIKKKHAINNNVSNSFSNRSVNAWNNLPTVDYRLQLLYSAVVCLRLKTG